MYQEQRGVTVWFTGLPCSGKTSIASELCRMLNRKGIIVEHLDGDVLRKSISSDLGFSEADRFENIRRAVIVAKLLTQQGIVVLASLVTPYTAMRDHARSEICDFIEVYVRCPLAVCIKRDVKGMYKKALSGQIPDFTGVSSPYEEPESPDTICDTEGETVAVSAQKVLDLLFQRGYIGDDMRGGDRE